MKSHKHPSSMVLQFRYIYVRRKQIITKTIDSLHTIATFFEILSMIEGRSSKQRAKGKKRSIRDKRNSRERTLSRLFDTHSLPLKHHSLSKRSISRCSSFFFLLRQIPTDLCSRKLSFKGRGLFCPKYDFVKAEVDP